LRDYKRKRFSGAYSSTAQEILSEAIPAKRDEAEFKKILVPQGGGGIDEKKVRYNAGESHRCAYSSTG
jgi:hypothetical protein